MANTQNTFKISQLRDIENLDGNDLFLVSDHTGGTFFTRKLSASVLFNKIQDIVVNHITTNEAFLDKLAEKIVKISGNEISSTITPNIQDTVIEQATPIVSAQAVPLVSSEALSIITDEAIPLISSDLLELTIQDIISSDVISSAVICVDTAIGYGVHSAIADQVDDAITDDIVSNVVNEISVNNYLSTCVVTTITDNREDIWDILTDGEHDNESEINAGGA